MCVCVPVMTNSEEHSEPAHSCRTVSSPHCASHDVQTASVLGLRHFCWCLPHSIGQLLLFNMLWWACRAGLSALAAEMCANRAAVATQLQSMFEHGVTTAPQHMVEADELLPALDDEETAAALWQELHEAVGAPSFQSFRFRPRFRVRSERKH